MGKQRRLHESHDLPGTGTYGTPFILLSLREALAHKIDALARAQRYAFIQVMALPREMEALSSYRPKTGRRRGNTPYTLQTVVCTKFGRTSHDLP